VAGARRDSVAPRMLSPRLLATFPARCVSNAITIAAAAFTAIAAAMCESLTHLHVAASALADHADLHSRAMHSMRAP